MESKFASETIQDDESNVS